eukprot:4155862-Amphidinium_carterae.1
MSCHNSIHQKHTTRGTCNHSITKQVDRHLQNAVHTPGSQHPHTMQKVCKVWPQMSSMTLTKRKGYESPDKFACHAASLRAQGKNTSHE